MEYSQRRNAYIMPKTKSLGDGYDDWLAENYPTDEEKMMQAADALPDITITGSYDYTRLLITGGVVFTGLAAWFLHKQHKKRKAAASSKS